MEVHVYGAVGLVRHHEDYVLHMSWSDFLPDASYSGLWKCEKQYSEISLNRYWRRAEVYVSGISCISSLQLRRRTVFSCTYSQTVYPMDKLRPVSHIFSFSMICTPRPGPDQRRRSIRGTTLYRWSSKKELSFPLTKKTRDRMLLLLLKHIQSFLGLYLMRSFGYISAYCAVSILPGGAVC